MLRARRPKAITIALVAIVAVVLVWLVWVANRPAARHAEEPLDAQPSEPRDAHQAELLTPVVSTAETDAREPAPAIAAEPSAPKERPAPVQEGPDLQAKAPLEILVVDENSKPVFDAEIVLRGMRSETDTGSWYSYRGEPPTMRTNAEGRARIDAWVWVNVDGKTSEVDLKVSHPDHPPFRDDSFAVGPGVHRIQLAPSARVVLHAWTGSPARRVENLAVHMEPETGVPGVEWTREGADWVTTRLAPGLHSIQVSSPSSSPQLFSEVQDFTVIAGETKDLPIELLPAETLEGRLGDEVPRPIVDGHVFLAVRRADFTEAYQTIVREVKAAVAADGTFSIPNVPRGRAYLFVLARGWSSPLVKADLAREAGMRFSKTLTPEEEAQEIERMGARSMVLPHTLLPQAERPLVVAMEQTGVVEFLVRDQSGAPVAGVKAVVSPNISIPDVGSTLVPWRDWSVPTDGQGRARIEDVPPASRLWAGAVSERWRLRAQDRETHPHVSVKPGETARVELVVEPNDPTKK